HAGLITDRPPSIDGASRLVHVAARPCPLTGTEDLTGASEVERVYLAGMAMQRNHAARLEPHQLRPAVRGETQRAERLARPGRDPRHAASVQRPGWFETHVAHGFLPWSGCVNVTAKWPAIQGQSGLVLLGQSPVSRRAPLHWLRQPAGFLGPPQGRR